MALSIENVTNWGVNFSGYCSHIITVIEKTKKLKEKTEKKLEPDSNLTRDSKLTRATNKLFVQKLLNVIWYDFDSQGSNHK